jgi:L-asparaginase
MPKIALIAMGGTISAVGRDALDIVSYDANETQLGVSDLLAPLPPLPLDAEILPIQFGTVGSTTLTYPHWRRLVLLCHELAHTHADLMGIVITHGTATLEETAYFLQLTYASDLPVVLVGSQRPSNALSSDANMNLYNALRVVCTPEARGMGVMVMLNDEIHAARDVSKTSTYRLQTFQSRDSGPLGYCDGDAVTFYREVHRRYAARERFKVEDIEQLPPVGIAYSYAGDDGAVIDFLVASGNRGIVSAGFAPGLRTPGETEAMKRAVEAGVVVVQSCRAGGGRVGESVLLNRYGFVSADNLNPQKARILLALSLAASPDKAAIAANFREY